MSKEKFVIVRRANERGHVNFGWLDSYHTFSFGSYLDPQFMGFSNLRVINEDTIEGGAGFEAHPHRNMEIITFVTSGALEHKDTLGKSSIIRPGEIQLMSAGAGIQHSEFNHYPDRKCSFFQIWIEPKEKNTKPKYEQRAYLDNKKVNGLTLLASSKEEGRGVVAINADASVYLGEWIEQNEISLPLDSGRSYWLQMIDGSIRVKADAVLNRGDGAAIKNQESFIGFALENSRILLFSLP